MQSNDPVDTFSDLLDRIAAGTDEIAITDVAIKAISTSLGRADAQAAAEARRVEEARQILIGVRNDWLGTLETAVVTDSSEISSSMREALRKGAIKIARIHRLLIEVHSLESKAVELLLGAQAFLDGEG